MGEQLWPLDRSRGRDGSRLCGRVLGKVTVGKGNESGTGLISETIRSLPAAG